ncbi:MAG: RcnB family protein [Hyphomonadaceae bacterium]|nr:RcnB family protein [Hyphomonadaceae bacterium]
MKKLLIAAAAAASFAAPLAATEAAAHDRHRGHYDRYDRYDRDYDDRDDRRDERRAYRDGYREGRWDDRRYNGYFYRGDWRYGPPPRAYYHDPHFRPGYVRWSRGHRLPPYYRERYVVVNNYHGYGLRAPPRGHHWVRDDRGDYLLVGIATGVILGVALAN